MCGRFTLQVELPDRQAPHSRPENASSSLSTSAESGRAAGPPTSMQEHGEALVVIAGFNTALAH